MTGTICSVATCKSNREKAKKDGEIIRFFTFPKNEQIRKDWVRLCHRKNKFDSSNKRICSRHFESEHYEDAIQAKITNTIPKKLKETAVPTLFLPNVPQKVSTGRSRRLEERRRKALIADILSSNNDAPPTTDSNDEISEMNIEDQHSTSNQSPYEILYSKYSALQKENESLRTGMLQDKNKVESLIQKNKVLQNIIDQMDTNVEAKVKDLLADFLTPNQLEIIMKKKTKARWTSNEISKAFTLLYFSKRAYLYMRQTLKYPLPGLSTLQSWAASNVDSHHGLSKAILKVLNTCEKDKTETQS